MIRIPKMRISLLFFFVAFIWNLPAKGQSDSQPNIIFILVDDLGYGDIGVFFQNERKSLNDRSEPWIMTPQLDKMAMQGAMMTDHYAAAPVCAPSRASILMGVNQGHAHVRDNQFDKEIGKNHTMAEVLRSARYTTVAVGKWGLQGKGEGPDWPTHPLKVGFDQYFGYIRHRDGHEHYPVEGVYRGSKEVYQNYETVQGLDKCYTGDLFTAKAKDFIIKHQAKDSQQPFFMYLAYDTPHAVLELPTQDYPAGGGLNGGIQWLGNAGKMINTASGEVDSFVYPEFANATYDHDKNEATPEVAWPDTYKRYATVNRRIDDQVGDLMQLLEDLEISENTLVVFTSDNGPSRESYLPEEYVAYTPEFFNNFAHFDGIKRDVYEGGLRTATIAHWPIHIKAGTVVNSPSISYDWMATFADAAGAPVPVRTDGVSLLPSLTGKGKQEPSQVYVEYAQGGKIPKYAEFLESHQGKLRGQMQMIRQGEMVGVRYNIQGQEDDFELYDVTKDPQQGTDLSSDREALQASFKAAALRLRVADAQAPRPYDEALVPSLEIRKPKKGLIAKTYDINSPWIPKLSQKAIANKKVNRLAVQEAPAKGNLVMWQGYLDVPEDGKYTFSANRGESHFFMRIHDISVLDGNYATDHSPIGSVQLEKGLHPVKIYYLKETQTPSLELFWTDQEGNKEEVPAGAWYR
ncbi:sulfatase-like hydrolase/transferase [Echinicola rosea]|uniref:N-acetylgalactosamine-6-sulfatase n=1 Tax=Echinicola rosea TaxID=1807691 RepID=A0ABQ1V9Y3_9BACT|nr:sulfatase-like hydrolase/transferase [Echinicola rosea]GGF46206.1 N-acetylgalactosamine-6-sulfatase [Echinicola rosea]